MEEYNIYLLAYSRKKEKLNRFYAVQGEVKEEFFWNIEEFAIARKSNPLENIADDVEAEFLNNNKTSKFISINGIKRILVTYNGIINRNRIFDIDLDKTD